MMMAQVTAPAAASPVRGPAAGGQQFGQAADDSSAHGVLPRQSSAPTTRRKVTG